MKLYNKELISEKKTAMSAVIGCIRKSAEMFTPVRSPQMPGRVTSSQEPRCRRAIEWIVKLFCLQFASTKVENLSRTRAG